MEDSSVDDIVEVFGEDLGLQPTVLVVGFTIQWLSAGGQ